MKITPKYLSYLSLNSSSVSHAKRRCIVYDESAVFETIDQVYDEMLAFAESGIYYALLPHDVPNNIKEQLIADGFRVQNSTIMWAYARWDGAIPFIKESHLSELKKGVYLHADWMGQMVNLYMDDDKIAQVGTTGFRIDVRQQMDRGKLMIEKIQLDSYWDEFRYSPNCSTSN